MDTLHEIHKATDRGPLYAGTKSLHHYVETETELGRAMHVGNPTDQQYAGWLTMKKVLFDAIDAFIPPACRRSDLLAADLEALGVKHPVPEAARRHCEWINAASGSEHERRLTGLTYVMCGTSIGAQVVRRALYQKRPELPASAMVLRCVETERAYLSQLRQRADCFEAACAAFRTVIESCNEITALVGDQE